MAAGEGLRLRPLTERWPKPVLPIDGKPVVVTLVHELAAAGCAPIVVVTGHLAEQVESLLAPLPYDLRFVRQPPGQGSADAVKRAEAVPPYLVSAADTVYEPGDLARFARAARDHDGAYAVHGSFQAPLWLLGAPVARFLDPLPGKAPYELRDVFRKAVDAGADVSAIQVGRTRDLTSAVDLVRENFGYLR
jgi:CTP:molybdopterin cytidylyltransferase MocA